MSSEKLRSALENGQVPSGCVTWVRPDQILEFKTLAQTHNITKAYALVCLAESAQVTPPQPGGVKRKLPATNRQIFGIR